MIDIVAFGITTALVIALFATVIIKNRKKKEQDTVVTLTDNCIKICWAGHEISFCFTEMDGQLYYAGTSCNELYSCAISTTGDEKFPWKIWAQIGDDTITIVTDIKTAYEVI